MNLRTKTFITFISTAIILTILFFFLSYRLVLHGFIVLEEEIMQENMQRAVNVLRTILNGMEVTSVDWAAWDDTYQYVQDRNDAYESSNLNDESLVNLKVNLFMIYTLEGERVFSWYHDPSINYIGEPSNEFNTYFDQLAHTITQPTSGLHVFDRPFFFTVYPIITSDKQGAPKGFLVLGKLLDSSTVSSLSQIGNLSISFEWFGNNISFTKEDFNTNKRLPSKSLFSYLTGSAISSSILENSTFMSFESNVSTFLATPTFYIHSGDTDYIHAYALLRDYSVDNDVLLSVEYPRKIYWKGRETIESFATFFLLATVFFSILSFILLDTFVVNRLLNLRKDILQSELDSTKKTRVRVQGNDELAWVAQSVNHLLSEVSNAREKLLNILSDAKNKNKRLEELDTAKTNFLNIISHELKTPLTAIFAYLDVLEEDNIHRSVQERKSIDALKRNSEQLRILINNILEMSRIEAGKFELSHTPMQVREKVSYVVKNLKILAHKKDLSIRAIFDKSTPSSIITDEPRFEEILNNLISNAIKFTEKGGIDVIVKGDKKNIIVSVKDTGVGISRDNIRHLFEKFYQVDSSISRKHGGTGLGLSITKQLVELQGGTIGVVSTFGKGSTFTFSLPLDVTVKGGVTK